jgi:hypothetical protein
VAGHAQRIAELFAADMELAGGSICEQVKNQGRGMLAVAQVRGQFWGR